jgi:hypothetical protein
VSTTDIDLARMIARLRTYRRSGHWRHKGGLKGYNWVPGKPIWTDEQIMKALNLPRERFDELVRMWKEDIPPRYLSDEEWKKRYFKFWDKNKRWHTLKDERNWRETGLCSNGNWYARTNWVEHYCALREGMLRKHPEMVFTIPNLTTRRNVLEKMGGADVLIQQLIKQGKAKKLQQDDFGTLWRLDFPDLQDSHMRYVEVVNSSPNEEGEYDHYYLRVPPDTRTAKAGVAWTFDKPATRFGFAAQS